MTIPGSPGVPSQPTTGLPQYKLAGFSVTIPKDVKTNTPFEITVKALDQYGATLTNYTGTVYFDLIVGAYTDMSPIALDEGYTFTAANN